MKKTLKEIDKAWLFFIPLFTVLLVLDQASKHWASSNFTGGPNADFGFVLSHNDGIVFGFDLPIWIIFILTGLILGLGTHLVIKEKLWRDKWHLSALACILAGAIGNLIDRVRFGYVIDFLKVYWWPTFNIADACIVVGVIILSWEILIREEAVSEL